MGVSLQQLEADMDGDETQLLPDIIAKLMFALTYNRQIKFVDNSCPTLADMPDPTI
jgi:hypothetical protein